MSNTIECPFCKSKINEDANVCSGCQAVKAAYVDQKWTLTRYETEILAADYLKQSQYGWLFVGLMIAFTIGLAIFADYGLHAVGTGVFTFVVALIVSGISSGYFKLKKALSEPDQWFRKT